MRGERAGAVFRAGASAGLGVLLLALRPDPAGALPADPLDWTARPFLGLYTALIVAGFVAAWLARTFVRFGAGPVRGEDLGTVALAYLSGGPRRAADAVVLGFLDAGAASLTGDGRIAVRSAWADLPASLEAFRGCGAGLETRRDLHKPIVARLEAVRDDLAGRGLILAGRGRTALRLATFLPVAAVLGLGLLKVGVGLSRGRPVGILVLLMIVTVAVALVAFTRAVDRTGAGDRVLAGYLARHARAARAPTAAEVVLAFALVGEGALPGTALAGYAALVAPADGGGGDGSGGDGGCGGGGCGGCGGGGD